MVCLICVFVIDLIFVFMCGGRFIYGFMKMEFVMFMDFGFI